MLKDGLEFEERKVEAAKQRLIDDGILPDDPNWESMLQDRLANEIPINPTKKKPVVGQYDGVDWEKVANDFERVRERKDIDD